MTSLEVKARPPILVLAGPTACGKTERAVDLALRLDAELIAADSVQIYCDFDIGSAKPREDELRGVPHHLISVLHPAQSIDAVAYAKRADEAIAEVAARGKLPLVVGGTGLWIRALLQGLVELPAPDPQIRRALEEEAERAGTAELHCRLAGVDPRAAARLHPNDRLRIVRALEVFEQTGRALGELHAEHALGEARYRSFMMVIDPEAESLRRRIEARMHRMFAQGWLEEVAALRARYGSEVKAFGSLGYKQLLAHLEGRNSLDETQQEILRATKAYARHQKTWFRTAKGVTWRGQGEALSDEITLDSIRRFLDL